MKRRFFLTFVVAMVATVIFAQPKYIFFMIGDGMGMSHIEATEMYLAELDGFIGRKQLCMTGLPYTGIITTYSNSNSITCSAAAGTALASGVKTDNGLIGITPDGTHPKTIAELLHDKGWNVGLMTSVSFDHATPASFYARSKSRNDYYTIGSQLPETGFEFFGGGTFYKPYLEDKPEAPNLYDLCEKAGYHFYRGYEEFMEKGIGDDRVILIQKHEAKEKDYLGSGRLPYAIDRKPDDMTLEQITDAAITFFEKKDKPFFMMVEGGQIDWACHSNDAATAILETYDFDMAIRRAYKFYRQHPKETLIVVTADHETGGLGMGNYKYTLNLQVLKNQTASAWIISDRLKEMHRTFGKNLKYEQVQDLFKETIGLYGAVEVTKEEDAELRAIFKKMIKNKAHDNETLYASLSALSSKAVYLLDKKAKIGWTSSSHTGSPVPVFAVGAGAELFTGMYDNTEIMQRMLKLVE